MIKPIPYPEENGAIRWVIEKDGNILNRFMFETLKEARDYTEQDQLRLPIDDGVKIFEYIQKAIDVTTQGMFTDWDYGFDAAKKTIRTLYGDETAERIAKLAQDLIDNYEGDVSAALNSLEEEHWDAGVDERIKTGSENTIKVKVLWDLGSEGEEWNPENTPPLIVEVPLDLYLKCYESEPEYIADWLSDEYGWSVFDWTLAGNPDPGFNNSFSRTASWSPPAINSLWQWKMGMEPTQMGKVVDVDIENTIIWLAEVENPENPIDLGFDEWQIYEHDGWLKPWQENWHQNISKTSAWSDVMEKAKRYLDEGRVKVDVNNWTKDPVSGNISNYVHSTTDADTGQWESEIWRDDPKSNVITRWTCDCPWGQVSWGRTRQYKKWEGRPCAHGLALHWQSQLAPNQTPPTEPEAPIEKKPVPAPTIPGAMNFQEETVTKPVPVGITEVPINPGVTTNPQKPGQTPFGMPGAFSNIHPLDRALNPEHQDYPYPPEGDDDRPRRLCPLCEGSGKTPEGVQGGNEGLVGWMTISEDACSRCDGAGYLYRPNRLATEDPDNWKEGDWISVIDDCAHCGNPVMWVDTQTPAIWKDMEGWYQGQCPECLEFSNIQLVKNPKDLYRSSKKDWLGEGDWISIIEQCPHCSGQMLWVDRRFPTLGTCPNCLNTCSVILTKPAPSWYTSAKKQTLYGTWFESGDRWYLCKKHASVWGTVDDPKDIRIGRCEYCTLEEEVKDNQMKLFFSSAMFRNGEKVRVRPEHSLFGVDRDGTVHTITGNRVGEILYCDEEDCVVVFPLGGGPLSAHLIRVETKPIMLMKAPSNTRPFTSAFQEINYDIDDQDFEVSKWRPGVLSLATNQGYLGPIGSHHKQLMDNLPSIQWPYVFLNSSGEGEHPGTWITEPIWGVSNMGNVKPSDISEDNLKVIKSMNPTLPVIFLTPDGQQTHLA